MKWTRVGGVAAAAAALVVGVTAASTSCSQTPANIPVRTFQEAQKVDTVCLAVNDVNGNPLPASEIKPLVGEECAPLPIGANGQTWPNHLYAVVTQSGPGTLAAVDLTYGAGLAMMYGAGTSGAVIDEDRSTPGINFIPVGPLPTDVAVAPDGKMTFVSSADVGKPALYAVDNRRLLGDSTGNPPAVPLRLTDLPACALPQPPDAMSVESLPSGGYVLVVMLRGWGGQSAKVAVVDPLPMLRGSGVAPGGADAGPVDAPGTLSPCTVLGATQLSNALPSAWTPGPVWPDGVPYVDGGVDLTDAEPPPAPVIPGPEGGVSTCAPSSEGDIGGPPPPSAGEPQPSAMTFRSPDPKAATPDKPLLYVADGAVPVIHVVDMSDPAHPAEQPPLLATSVRNPGHRESVGALAVSPPGRDGRRYLYAVDASDGTVMVFDVTDPVASPHVPLRRPHAELNPFVPSDRLAFTAPAVTVAFAQHDWLLPSQIDPNHYYSGLLCNPNPNAHPSPTDFVAKGAYYRADQAALIQNTGIVENFPSRLRGVFGFVTLSNGSVVVVDVDDWDAPCRRPDPMTDGGGAYPGLLNRPEPEPANNADLDPYHAPVAYQASIQQSAAVTEEAFFPVSAPNRARSNFLLENDPYGGNHMPGLLGAPILYDQNGSPIPLTATAPLILPTNLPAGFVDPANLTNPTYPDPSGRTVVVAGAGSTDAGAASVGLSVSYDDPTAQIDQAWLVTYEGVLPNTPGEPIDLVTTDDYQTLTLTTGVTTPDAGAPADGLGTPGFCALGIEDWSIGRQRAAAAQALNANPGVAITVPPSSWTSDYVEIADDLLPEWDPYWNTPYKKDGQVINDCWGGTGLENDSASDIAAQRYYACADRFGANATDAGVSGLGTLADTYLSRDFPIIQAFDDHLVLGRFGWDPGTVAAPNAEDTTTRVVVGVDGSQSTALFHKMARCCFHHQAAVKVRTGGEWVAVGTNGIGLLHHVVVGPGGACVLSCNSEDVLRNARTIDLSVPFVSQTDAQGKPTACSIGALVSTAPDRNDPTALRNPMFSFYIQPPTGVLATCEHHTLLNRDIQWQFAMQGGFSGMSVSISGGNAIGVSPQSMRFIQPLGQMAVVDGAQQGLVLIDLNTMGFSQGPYF